MPPRTRRAEANPTPDPTPDPDTKETAKAPAAIEDNVAMASRRADGSPDQTDGFAYAGDPAGAIKGTKAQLATQTSAALDAQEQRAAQADAEASAPDPETQARLEARGEAIAAAEGQAEAEVKARHPQA